MYYRGYPSWYIEEARTSFPAGDKGFLGENLCVFLNLAAISSRISWRDIIHQHHVKLEEKSLISCIALCKHFCLKISSRNNRGNSPLFLLSYWKKLFMRYPLTLLMSWSLFENSYRSVLWRSLPIFFWRNVSERE